MNKKGFTLIEIIFSVAFLSVVSVVMLSLLVTSFEVENETDMMDIAILHISNEIEEVKSAYITKDQVIEKFYSQTWKLVDQKDAKFKLIIEINKNNMYEQGLYDIKGSVVYLADSETIIDVETKHYFERK